MSGSAETMQEWRAFVLARDGHQCQSCGATAQLHAHHIHPVRLYPHERLARDNGTTLCKSCHFDAHRTHPWIQPKTGQKVISIRLEEALYEAVSTLAGQADRSINGEIVQALRAWVAAKPPTPRS